MGLNKGDEDLQFKTSDGISVTSSFEDMPLPDTLLRGIYSHGFRRPSAIQSRAILPIAKGRDLICQAQSGTGKTATFSIGALARCARQAGKKKKNKASSSSSSSSGKVDPNFTFARDHRHTQVIILSPTRELASQTAAVVAALGDFVRCSVHALTGGRTIAEDIRRLESGVHVVSGTPGRVTDMIRRRHLRCDRVLTLIVDEADEMMGLGLRESISEVYRFMPPSAQVVLVSATMTPEVMETAREITTEPLRVMVRRDEVTLGGIAQFRVDVGVEAHKYATLCDLYGSLSVAQCVVFCNTRKRAAWLSEKLTEGGFAVATMHGDMTQGERDKVMGGFRGGRTRVLVTTDILARGIDVSQVSVVINYDVPTNKEVYVHRIGRSGRFGRKGVAINFVCDEDNAAVTEIEKFYDTRIAPLPAKIEGVFAALG